MDFIKAGNMPDSSRIINELTKYKALQKENTQELLIKAFELALDLHLNKNTTLSSKELANITGMKPTYLIKMKEIIKLFNYDKLSFLEFIEKHNCTTIAHVHSKCFQTVSIDIAKRDLTAMLKSVYTYLREQRSQNKPIERNVMEDLSNIRKVINKYVPAEPMKDAESLHYYNCCCCGEYPPPPEGFKLTFSSDRRQVVYPICPLCDELEAPPDYTIIAEMYANYISNLESAYANVLTMLR